jgi:hypothetical protein
MPINIFLDQKLGSWIKSLGPDISRDVDSGLGLMPEDVPLATGGRASLACSPAPRTRPGARCSGSSPPITTRHHPDRCLAVVEGFPKTDGNQNRQAKVRQPLQGDGFRRVAPTTYELAIAQ